MASGYRKKMLNVTVRNTQIKTTKRYHLSTAKRSFIKKIRIRMWRNWNLFAPLAGKERGTGLGETAWVLQERTVSWSHNLTSWHSSKIKIIFPKKYIHSEAHFSTVHNS